ncbi:MAG: hypothetical protein E7554_00535 [Ruminococcaceae bacterium]|nr:hypothetical protein [Oscillospiraceae bacterium]
MMKKILTAAVLLLVCLFAFVGCSDGQAAQVSEAAHGGITQVTIEYDPQPGVHRKVVIDRERSEKKIVDYAGTKTESAEAFTQTGSLSEFIDSRVLGSSAADADHEGGSEELVLWKVRVTTAGDTTTLYGTESEGFPEFWEELLLLAGE